MGSRRGYDHAELFLGEIEAREGRYAEAESPLLQSLALWRKQLTIQKKPIDDALSYLARTYDGLHESAKAQAYRQQLAGFQN